MSKDRWIILGEESRTWDKGGFWFPVIQIQALFSSCGLQCVARVQGEGAKHYFLDWQTVELDRWLIRSE